MDKNDRQDGKALSIFGVFGSVLSAMFGVQSSSRRAADFTYGKPWQFILAGLVMLVVFVLSIWIVVSLVISQAGV